MTKSSLQFFISKAQNLFFTGVEATAQANKIFANFQCTQWDCCKAFEAFLRFSNIWILSRNPFPLVFKAESEDCTRKELLVRSDPNLEKIYNLFLKNL